MMHKFTGREYLDTAGTEALEEVDVLIARCGFPGHFMDPV